MRNKLYMVLPFCLLLATTAAHSQNKLSIDKVYKVTLRNSGTITENNQIKGYYFLYMSDKVDKHTNQYTLQIVDENLNKLKDIKFTDSKDIVLLESSYNGSSLGFLFFNDKENSLEYRLFNMDGKQSFSYSKVLDKKSEAYFKAQMKMSLSEESENKNVFDIPSKGYLSVTPLRENRNYTYEVSFYASDKRRSWTYNPVEDGKFAAAQYLGSNDSIALIEVMSKDKLMSKDVETSIVGINLANGRKAFETRAQDGKFQLLPMNVTKMRNSSDFIVVGLYYDGGDRVLTDKSDGLGIWLMDNKGKIVKSKYVSWNKDLAKHLKVDQKGRIGDLGYLYIHRIMQTEDGKIFAIGEGYKKVADGVGIAMNILTQSYTSGVTKLKITDMLMLEMSPGFELTNAQIYAKNNNSFSLSTGSDFASPHSLALFAKAYGAFDYTYSQMGADNASFSSAYIDYEKSKGYKGSVFNAISYYDGKLSTDKINLKTDATNLVVLPAKPGSVLLIEYFKKDKRLDLRMEKIN